MKKTRILLIRHGEVHNPDEILYGRMPGFRLSDNGRQQAAAAGRALKHNPPYRLFASPQQRAQETAGIIAQEIGMKEVITDPRLDETHTPWDGRPLAELVARNFDLYTGSSAPYEQPEDILKRTLNLFADLRRDFAGQTVAAVTHGDVVAFMFLYAKQHPVDTRLKGSLEVAGLPEAYPATASISSLTFFTDDPEEIPEYEYLRPY